VRCGILCRRAAVRDEVARRSIRSWSLLIVATSVAMLVAGCATPNPRTAAERAVDDDLVARVDRALRDDPNIYARHIDIDVNRGVVRLSGFVWTSDDLYAARRVASTVPGVTRVVDQLELMVGGRTGAR